MRDRLPVYKTESTPIYQARDPCVQRRLLAHLPLYLTRSIITDGIRHTTQRGGTLDKAQIELRRVLCDLDRTTDCGYAIQMIGQ